MARPTLYNHRKFRALALALDSQALALGSLELIWRCGYDSGDALLGDSAAVENAADWRGKRGRLTSILVECGFLDSTTAGYAIHDLLDHAPDYVRKRKKREEDRRTTDRSVSGYMTGQRPVGTRTNGDRVTSTPAPAPARAPAPAPPYPPAPTTDGASTNDAAAAASPPAREGTDANGAACGEVPVVVFRGRVLVVDRELHERCRRTGATERFLREQYPMIDDQVQAKAGSPKAVRDVPAYLTKAIAGRWREIVNAGDDRSYRDPPPHVPPPALPQIDPVEYDEGREQAARILESLSGGSTRTDSAGPLPIGAILAAAAPGRSAT